MSLKIKPIEWGIFNNGVLIEDGFYYEENAEKALKKLEIQ